MMFIRKSVVVSDLVLAVYSAIEWVSMVAALTLKPAPGLTMLATSRPIASANVETISK